MTLPLTAQIPVDSAYFGFFQGARSYLVGQDAARQRKMAGAWLAYHGQFAPALKRRGGAPDDNVYVNLCRVVVEKGVAFLFGRGVHYQFDQDQTRSDAERYLDDVWAHNGRDALLQRLAINGGVCGQAFLKIRIEQPFPRLLALDPQKVTVETAPDDWGLVNAYVIRWDGVESKTNKPRAYRQRIARVPAGSVAELDTQHWVIVDQEAEPADAGDERAWVTKRTEVWPYDFAPIVEAQNLPYPNDYWGQADLEPDIVQLNDAINRTLSNIGRIIRLHAHPKTWTRGLSAEQIRQVVIDPEGMIHLPGDTAEIKNLEMQSDLASSVSHYVKLREAMYEVTRVPEVASGKVENMSYLSAMAMQVLYGPLIEKTHAKRATYGRLIVEVCRRLLVIAGHGSDRLVQIVWPEVLPRDRQIEATTAETEIRIGLSTDTALAKLGYDVVYERERRKADIEEALAKEERLAKAKAPARPAPTESSA